MSSRTGSDAASLHKLSRDRISIKNLTNQPQATPSTSPTTALSSSSATNNRFLAISGRSTSGNKGYRITIVQQPSTGAAHGLYYLSRVPLAPALIVRLDVVDMTNHVLPVDDEIPFFVSTLQLLDENGFPIRDPPDDPKLASAQPSAQRLLYGSLVSSPYSLVDLSGRRGIYFMFPDVSIRIEGKFRLGVSLTRLRDHEMTLISSGFVAPLAQVYTDVFTVTSQAEYVAPPNTQLSLHFHQQGAPKT